jgi:prophage DNA circulation protein
LNLIIDTAGFAKAAQRLVASVSAATSDPQDAIQALSNMAAFSIPSYASGSVTANLLAKMQATIGNLFRRAAVVSLARASVTYSPSSHDDALALRDRITGLIDNEMQIAGDSGENLTFVALNTLRAGVVSDLTFRAGGLPSLVVISTMYPVPAPVLAQRQYQDGSRDTELILEANARHPAFMPTNFKALGQ